MRVVIVNLETIFGNWANLVGRSARAFSERRPKAQLCHDLLYVVRLHQFEINSSYS